MTIQPILRVHAGRTFLQCVSNVLLTQTHEIKLYIYLCQNMYIHIYITIFSMHSLCSQDLYVKRRYFIIYKYHVTRYNIIGYNTVYFCIYLYVTYFDICNYICLDTSYHFSALYLLLKYCSLFFQELLY